MVPHFGSLGKLLAKYVNPTTCMKRPASCMKQPMMKKPASMQSKDKKIKCDDEKGRSTMKKPAPMPRKDTKKPASMPSKDKKDKGDDADEDSDEDDESNDNDGSLRINRRYVNMSLSGFSKEFQEAWAKASQSKQRKLLGAVQKDGRNYALSSRPFLSWSTVP